MRGSACAVELLDLETRGKLCHFRKRDRPEPPPERHGRARHDFVGHVGLYCGCLYSPIIIMVFIGDSVNVEMIDNVLLLDQKASGKPPKIHLRIRDVVGETWSYNVQPVNLYRSGLQPVQRWKCPGAIP